MSVLSTESPRSHGCYIDGEWRSTDEQIDVVSPYTETVIATVSSAGSPEVDAAVAAARRSYEYGPWARLGVDERIAWIRRLGERYLSRLDDVATTVTAEMGAPVNYAQAVQAQSPALVLSSMCKLAATFPWQESRRGPAAGDVVVQRLPVGVVAVITPWNAPVLILMQKIVPALLAGCSVVVKPSPEAPLSTLLVARLLDELDVPAGVFNVVTGGASTGELLVSHPEVDHVTFTGSTSAGRVVGSACGATLTRVQLELGGKSPALVLDDADVDRVVDGVSDLVFGNSGQMCIAHSRLLVPRARQNEFTDAFVARAEGLRVGNPNDPATDLGPLVTSRHRQRVRDLIDVGIGEGATLCTGGTGPVPGLDCGWFVRPTVFADVVNSMAIAREEVFGPVLSVLPYDTIDDAVGIANDSEYGLAASVWGADHDRAARVAGRLRAGTVGVNGYTLDFTVPFGGFRSSGIGREYGHEGLAAFTETRALLGVDCHGE